MKSFLTNRFVTAGAFFLSCSFFISCKKTGNPQPSVKNDLISEARTFFYNQISNKVSVHPTGILIGIRLMSVKD